MGAVYQARQTKLGRLVALKVLPADRSRDPAFAARFAREAQALARLSHPHIVAVHDFGEADGLFYLLMEFVDGGDLRRRMQAGPVQPEEALRVVGQVCEALQYAHEEGVVHRDIKPENILLDKRGRVRVADFGLAKLLGRSPADLLLTGSQQVLGTLNYIAPEQIERPLQVDHRADIYSLGVVFYELLTGGLPLGRFAPASQKVVMDSRIDEIVLRALEKDPERRYQHVVEMKADLGSLGKDPAYPPQEGGIARTAVRPPTQPTLPLGEETGRFRRSARRGFLRRCLGSTTGWAMILCSLGILLSSLLWFVDSPHFVYRGHGLLCFIVFLSLLFFLLETGFIEPVPVWRPLALMVVGIVAFRSACLIIMEVELDPDIKLVADLTSSYYLLVLGIGIFLLGTHQMKEVLVRWYHERTRRPNRSTDEQTRT
jgi:hypothetical protein